MTCITEIENEVTVAQLRLSGLDYAKSRAIESAIIVKDLILEFEVMRMHGVRLSFLRT